MKILVVDDEAPARRRLIRMLERIADVEVVGEAGDGIDARDRIAELSPELVLLDIEMPGLDGLSLAASEGMPAIVFTTAHEEHAVEAFRLAAFDYLLKPVTSERLEQAIARVRARGRPSDPAELAAALGSLIQAGAPSTPRITARSGSTVHVFDAREIGRFHAAEKYTVFRHEGAEYLMDDSLSALEARLEPHEFIRVHRAELVNLARVRALHGDGAGTEVELAGGERAPVSRRLVAVLKRRLGIV